MGMSAIAAQPWTTAKPVVRTASTGSRPAGSRPVGSWSASASAVAGRSGARPVRHLVVVPDVTSLPERPRAVRSAAVPVAPAPLRLTRRGRAVLVLLGLLVVVAGVLGGQAVADGPERAVEVVTHAVQSGETLWQIAAGVTAPGEDVRDVVAELQELNGLADGSLVAGQVLLLPAD